MTPQIKMILALVWVLVCFGAGVTTGYKWQELKYVQLQNQIYADNKRDMDAALAAATAQIEATETARANLQKNIEAAQNDNAKLANDLDSGRKWLRVLVRNQRTCPASTSTGGTADELAEVAPDVRRDILDFRERVIEHDARMEFLEVTCRGRYGL